LKYLEKYSTSGYAIKNIYCHSFKNLKSNNHEKKFKNV